MYTRRLTSWLSKLSNKVCIVSFASKFKTFLAPLFVNKNFKCGYAFYKLELKEHFDIKIFWLSRNVLFRSCSPTSERRVISKTVRRWYVRERIDYLCSVSTGKSQPSGSTRSSGKFGKPSFPLERSALGLGFSCSHWTFMMDSYPTREIYEPRHDKTCLRGLRPGRTQTGLLSYRDKLGSWSFGYRN